MTQPEFDQAGFADQAQASVDSALLEQFTQSLEEVTWLRRITKHFELRDARHPVSEVAGEVLPELRCLVLAESIGLLPVEFTCGRKRGFQATWDGPIYGKDAVAELLCHQVEASLQHPVVMNRPAVSGTPLEEYGIHSFILMPVSSAQQQVGWLIAINRDIDNRPANMVPPEVFPHEVEFGTVEAGLLQAAAALLATHARNVALFEDKERLLIGVIGAMSGAVDARDRYTNGHSRRVATYARMISREMGLGDQECERIHVTGLLHDIGKIGVPDAVLKKTGSLTQEEFEIMKRHPVTGYEILKQLDELSYVLPGVLHHHERVDGRGYPSGLLGEAIPLMARILAVADSYDAMTSSRPYRSAMPSEKAESILMKNAGTQWDEVVVAAFFRRVDDMRQVADSRDSDLQESVLPGQPTASESVIAELQSPSFRNFTLSATEST